MTATASVLDRIESYVTTHGRPLDAARLGHAVHGAAADEVVDALAPHQNEDGGFGHALEGDLRLPESSATCTWVALGLLIELGVAADDAMIRHALGYLRATYDAGEGRWQPVGPEVNEHPHGGWWHWEEGKGTDIHASPWNPTAALTGYLWHLEADIVDLTALTTRAIAYLESKADTDLEMHELRSLVELAEHAPAPHAEPLQALTTAAVERIVERRTEDFGGYGAQPLHFVQTSDHFLCAVLAEPIGLNLDYWMDTLGDDGVWGLTYRWGRDDDEFERLRPQLTSSFAVHRVETLRAFGRL